MINVEYDNFGNELAPGLANSTTILPPGPIPPRYKILRQPTPTSAEPYQLPEGTAIDLRASGVGDNRLFLRAERPRQSRQAY